MTTRLILFSLTMLSLFSNACKSDNPVETPKQTYVLVHGAFAGKSAWNDVKPLLEKAGHTVLTLDLPGHGDDQTPLGQISFDSYVDAVSKLINSQPGKVVLVGHSMAGVVISAVAEKTPQKLDKLVYLSAYLPLNGQSLQDLGGTDAQSLIGPNLKFAPDYSSATLPADISVQVFAVDCPQQYKDLVVKTARPEPLAAFGAKAALTAANFGSVPKYYIETLKDQGVGTALQEKMIAANGTVKKVYKIDSSHSPYWAKPAELAQILVELN
jgi:pimeloyl-ACP methyl ester carboxylesterase